MSMRNPFDRMEEMLEDLSREFEEARGELGSELTAPAVDVAESDGEFVVTADLPGFEKDEIDVRVTDSTLHISAERESRTESESEQFVRRERSHQSVSRSIPLPEAVDADRVEATCENGILTVTLPKSRAEAETDHEIEIQ